MLTRCDKFHYWNRAARCGYRNERERFYAGRFIPKRRTRCSFVLFHPGVYNGTLQDQSSSHLSAVLEMPDRYFTARSRFVWESFFVRVCALCACVHVHAKASLSQIFYSRLSHFRGGDDAKGSCVSRWLFGVIEGASPRWCKLNRKRLLGLYIFQRSSSPVIHESSFCLGLCPSRCPLFWCVSQSIGKFIRT